MSTFIIAEAGVNHNGEDKLAYELVDVAVAARANAVKFQRLELFKKRRPKHPIRRMLLVREPNSICCLN